MKNLVSELQKYLVEALDIKIQTHLWKGQNKLPFFLTDSYDFFETTVLNTPCLLMIAKDETEVTPATIQKYWNLVMSKWNAECIYVQTNISSYNRKRLIKTRVPFVIPNNQIYLPDLKVDLREHFQKQRYPKKFFSPAAQVVVIFALLEGTKERYTPSKLAKKLGYSIMTMTRCFNELETSGIGEMITKGKERWWLFKGTKRDLWEQTKTILRSPVKTTAWIKGNKLKTLAGISALADITMLNPPPLPVYAIGKEGWRAWDKTQVRQLPSPEEADFELEIWHYDPNLFASDGRVDSFSLYLSLEANKDERIEIALEELLETTKW